MNNKIKTSFVNPEEPKIQARKTSMVINIFILVFDNTHDFLVWLRTGYNPANSN